MKHFRRHSMLEIKINLADIYLKCMIFNEYVQKIVQSTLHTARNNISIFEYKIRGRVDESKITWNPIRIYAILLFISKDAKAFTLACLHNGYFCTQ